MMHIVHEQEDIIFFFCGYFDAISEDVYLKGFNEDLLKVFKWIRPRIICGLKSSFVFPPHMTHFQKKFRP